MPGKKKLQICNEFFVMLGGCLNFLFSRRGETRHLVQARPFIWVNATKGEAGRRRDHICAVWRD
jgi:hypothetical protein